MSYKVIEGNTAADVQYMVTRTMMYDRRWTPQGGICYANGKFFQAMVLP